MKVRKHLKRLNCWLFGHRINVYMLVPPGSDSTPCVKCGKMFSYARCGFINEDVLDYDKEIKIISEELNMSIRPLIESEVIRIHRHYSFMQLNKEVIDEIKESLKEKFNLKITSQNERTINYIFYGDFS